MPTSAPPRLVPSSLVTMSPVRGKDSLKARACSIEFVPRLASTTSQLWCGAEDLVFVGHVEFFQLLHQIIFGMEASGGIEDEEVFISAFGGIVGIEGDGS